MKDAVSVRIAAALRRAGVTGVDESVRRRAEYSSDASLYRVVPSVVVFPREADEVAAVVAVCRSERVPLTARGGGTSIAGNSVGSGVVLDFSRYLNRIHDIDQGSATAVVEETRTELPASAPQIAHLVAGVLKPF